MNQKQSDRITRLETQFSDMRLVVNDTSTDIKKIMRNEFPHVKESILKLRISFDKKINKLDKKVGILWLKVSIVTTILISFISYLMRRFLP